MKEAKGWIAIHRKLWLSEIWADDPEPFDQRSAWIDLIMQADFADGGDTKRGQLITSYRTLSKRWKWSKNKVVFFIRELEKKGAVKAGTVYGPPKGTGKGTEQGTGKGTPQGTLLTIENYAKYQDVRDTSRDTSRDTKQDRNRDNSRDRKRDVNNNINNIGTGSRLCAPGPVPEDPPLGEPYFR